MLGYNWFYKLFGFQERDDGTREQYEHNRSRFAYDPDTGVLTCVESGKAFNAGFFKTPSVSELREELGEGSKLRKLLPGTLRVQEVVGDVSRFHVARENEFATFQAASQFNCLEFVAPEVVPEAGITRYARDRTQGPACAIACAPGTVVRNYFAFPDGEGQTVERQVECLKDVDKLIDNERNQFFYVVGGYSDGHDKNLQKFGELLRDEKLKEEVVKNIRIGVQQDTQVTSSKFGAEPYSGPEQLVTQAYCSACAVAYSRSARESSWEPFARVVLEAAYEATLYVALKNALTHKGQAGCKKVFLTALGGGVFGNDERWIADAMLGAFERFAGVDLQVYIVSFGQPWRRGERLLGKYVATPSSVSI